MIFTDSQLATPIVQLLCSRQQITELTVKIERLPAELKAQAEQSLSEDVEAERCRQQEFVDQESCTSPTADDSSLESSSVDPQVLREKIRELKQRIASVCLFLLLVNALP